MIYSNIDFTVLYVDPSASTNGDGATPQSAMNALPGTAAAFADNTAYIIRRTAETSAVKLPNGTNSNLKNVLFIGMPNATDTLYNLMPQEAKSAWGADVHEYANIQFDSTSGSFQLPSINHFLLHRVYLFRDSINADGYIFKMNNTSSRIGCYSIENCKFGSRGINLDKTNYTEELTASRCKAYVSVYYARMLNVTNCIMNYAVTGNSNSPCGIYCYFADILNVDNVKVYSAVCTDVYNSYPLFLSGTYQKGIECRIRNVEETIRFNGSASKIPTLFCLQGYISCEISDITVKMGTPLSANRPTAFSIELSLMQLANVYELSLTNVDVSLPDCWNARNPVLKLERCYSGNYVPGIVKKVDNVRIALADESGIGTPITYDSATGDGESNAAVVMSFTQSDCTFYPKVPQITNLTVINPRGKAAYIETARLTDATFAGTVVLAAVEADILSLSTWFPGKAIHVSDGTHARVRSLTVNIDNPQYPYNEDAAVASPYNERGSIFVDESNVALAPMTSNSSTAQHIYQGIGCNNEGAEGHFAFRCENGLCDTWSVHRQGGGASALKFLNNVCSNPETMVLGRRPFNGMQLTPVNPGRHILKAHIAFKGYAKPAEMYRHFIISATIGGKVYYSTVHGRWADDSASTWVNDSELQQQVLEMPVDIPDGGVVDVRVYFSWYSSGGFVFLDPDIELEEA